MEAHRESGEQTKVQTTQTLIFWFDFSIFQGVAVWWTILTVRLVQRSRGTLFSAHYLVTTPDWVAVGAKCVAGTSDRRLRCLILPLSRYQLVVVVDIYDFPRSNNNELLLLTLQQSSSTWYQTLVASLHQLEPFTRTLIVVG